MRIAIIATEYGNLASRGGISGYVKGLVEELVRRGHDVYVILPRYAFLLAKQTARLLTGLSVHSGHPHSTDVDRLVIDSSANGSGSLEILLLGSHPHFERVTQQDLIYDWSDAGPWIAFSRAVVDFLAATESDWRPEVVHCHDAHTSLIPVYLSQFRLGGGTTFATHCRTVLTVHNTLYKMQGNEEIVGWAGLDSRLFGPLFEFWDWGTQTKAAGFRAGVLTADMVTTVSRTYADELCSSNDISLHFRGVLEECRSRGRFRGIINGIDEQAWQLDGVDYMSTNNREVIRKSKQQARNAWFRRLGHKDHNPGDPILAFRGRPDEQKGFELFEGALHRILDEARLLFVTWGRPSSPALARALEAIKRAAEQRPDRLWFNPSSLAGPEGIPETYKISDFFLMPSRYEPCGLPQLEAQRFGTIALVRRTGGLADTVSEEPTDRFRSPNGIVFNAYSADDFANAVHRAVVRYRDTEFMGLLIDNALLQRNGWANRIAEYEAVYGI